MEIERDAMKLATATLGVVVVLDVLTNGDVAVKLGKTVFQGWGAILQILTGKKPTIGTK